MQAVTAGMVAAMRERLKATVVLAVFLIVTGLTLGLAREAIAYTFNTGYDRGAVGFPRDSDGRVPEATGRLNGGGAPSSRDRHVYGQTSWWVYVAEPYQETRDSIKYDWRETDYCNVSRDKVYAHERAHSRGWGHGRGSPGANAAYYASITCWP